MTAQRPPIVVVGGGVAALEFVLALRALAEDDVAITIVAPDTAPALRPLQLHATSTPSLADLAPKLGAEIVPGTVAMVDHESRLVRLREGDTIAYDTLLLAPGATALPAFDGVLHLGLDRGAPLERLHDEIDQGLIERIAFVIPTRTGWLVPAYDAALLTAGRRDGLQITLVTPEEQPLESFGPEASALVAGALADASISVRRGQASFVQHGVVELLDGGTVEVDRVAAIPLVRGPRIAGVPTTGLFGLIPVDAFGRVTGIRDVYAIGDATDFPVKQAALACDQADAAAEHVSLRYGRPEPANPFSPRPRATLHDHRGNPLLLNGGQGLGKLPGRHLAPFVIEHLKTSVATA
jgi:sulfide:quinone oxidoreductase